MKRDWNSTIFTLFENWKLLSNALERCGLWFRPNNTLSNCLMHCRVWIKLGWLGLSGHVCHFRLSFSLRSLHVVCLSHSLNELTSLSSNKMTLENGQGEAMSSQLILSSLSPLYPPCSTPRKVIETRNMTFLSKSVEDNQQKRREKFFLCYEIRSFNVV